MSRQGPLDSRSNAFIRPLSSNWASKSNPSAEMLPNFTQREVSSADHDCLAFRLSARASQRRKTTALLRRPPKQESKSSLYHCKSTSLGTQSKVQPSESNKVRKRTVYGL
ncbi:predicted protein [Sclerotinia sclerotiorum 1980 UF-70]|uniref:Uncharacterized protein n=1 Tax=Sclerotinia sclerotiorum (strain ATCC 18683 / 1980 / Ss-1) TaxID=665079 RepID=A7EPE3_SCLS1|nr:predicted protein [Sclerotinia sclerotiorum 1980 UF-70]EDO04709.1 predicted protein [Sclerotinia sclerotiorum 1980 UF-70]